MVHNHAEPRPDLEAAATRTPARGARRGVWACAALMGGMAVADALPALPALAWLAGVCAVLCVLGVAVQRARGGDAHALVPPVMPALLLAAWMLGGGVYAWRVHTVDAGHWWVAQASQGGVISVRARVSEGPRAVPLSDQWERPAAAEWSPLRAVLLVNHVRTASGWQSAGGEVVVLARGGGIAAQVGDVVEVTGVLERWGGSRNPGEAGALRWASQQGRVGQIALATPAALVIVPRQEGLSQWPSRVVGALQRAVAQARTGVTGSLSGAMGTGAGGDDDRLGRGSALLAAMILGVEEPSLRPVYADMSRIGIVHILSISGFHLALVAWVVVNLIRLTGDRGAWEYLLAGAAIGAYLLVVPAEAPVVRSGVMVLALLAAEASGRRYDRLNILAWTAFALALWRPADIFSPGFQLSFGVTAALLWRGQAWTTAVMQSGLLGLPRVRGRIRTVQEGAGRWWLTRAVELVTSTALAWLVSAPVIIWHTGVLAIGGVVAGIVLTVPSILAIGLGFVAMVVGLVWPGGAAPLGWLAVQLCGLVVDGSSLAAALPGAAVALPSLPYAWVIVTIGVTVAAIAPGGWARAWVRLSAGCVLIALAVLLLLRGSPDVVIVDRLSIDGSSATLVQRGASAMMIDPGSKAGRAGLWTISRAARAAGAWRIRTVVITGAEPQRFNHLPELIRTWGVVRVVVPADFAAVARSRPMGDAARLLRALDAQGVEVVTPGPSGPWAMVGETSATVAAPGMVRLDHARGSPQLWSLAPVPVAERTVLNDGRSETRSWNGARFE